MDNPHRYEDDDSEYPTLAGAVVSVEQLHEAHTWEEWRKVWIDRGICPRSDHTPLEEGACPCCGWSIDAEKALRHSVVDKPDYLPTLPGALSVDEYAPADVDAAA